VEEQMGKIRVAQAYTGPIGLEIIRRLAGHPQMELVGVLVHSPDKAGRDSGELAGVAPNGIRTTQSLDEIIALKPQGIFWSGSEFDVAAYARILAAGINLYTGIGGYYLKGQPQEAELGAAAERGQASFCAGGNIPGLISDILPLFLTGYTGKLRHIRAWQRNHMDHNPSAVQMQRGLGIGLPPGGHPFVEQLNAGFTATIAQPARLIADSLGLKFEGLELIKVEYALAPERTVLERSGLVIDKDTVAGVRWTWVGHANGQEFYKLSNEQTTILGLGEGWRETYEEPAYRVEIRGDPSMDCTLGWPSGSDPAMSNYNLNVARAMNIMPRLVAARSGLLTPMDFPMPVAADGLAPL
jgi:4-hydroxy-tetrahydrodipicolinate reductase